MDGIGTATLLRRGTYGGDPGVYWAWRVDGYYDLHFAAEGVAPDGSDVVAELFATMSEARAWARELSDLERRGLATR
jgi:hypothetical protein